MHFNLVGADKLAVATQHRHLAHLGHLAQTAGQLADDLFLVAAQLVDVDFWGRELDAGDFQVLDFVHHGSDVQQRLGGDAAHVQAHATQGGVALDQHDLQAQVGGAEGGGVAAGAAAEHDHVGFQITRARKVAGNRCGNRNCWRRCCLGWSRILLRFC